MFCTSGAATVIKSYSPELIVMPYLPHLEEGEDASSSAAQQRVAAAMELVAAWLGRMSAVVVGPGLGDDPLALATASRVIQAARQAGLPLLVDGSGLNIIARQPELVQGYRCVSSHAVNPDGAAAVLR